MTNPHGCCCLALLLLLVLLLATATATTATTTTTTTTTTSYTRKNKQSVRLSWINGIGYQPSTFASERKQLQRMFGVRQVHGCYNPSRMKNDKDLVGFAADLARAGTHKVVGPPVPRQRQVETRMMIMNETTTTTTIMDDDDTNATTAAAAMVQQLVQHLRQQLAQADRVVHLCHSHGVLLTARALEFLPLQDVRRLEIIAAGGAATIGTAVQPKNNNNNININGQDAYNVARCRQYYSINDPLLWLVPNAVKVLRTGTTFHNDEEVVFCFLTPRTGDPVTDHYLLEPTYKQALEWEAARFRKLYGDSSKDVVWFVLLWPFVVLHQTLRTLVTVLWVRPIVYGSLWSYRTTMGVILWLQRHVYETLFPLVRRIFALFFNDDDNNNEAAFVPVQ